MTPICRLARGRGCASATNQFALMEGQILLATIAQRVSFEAVADQDERKPGVQVVEPGPLVTLRPKHGIKVKVIKE